MAKLGQGGGLNRSWGKKPKGVSVNQLDKVMKGPKVKAGVDAKTKAMQEYWKGIAPVFGDKEPRRKTPEHGQPGSYRDSIIVKDISIDGGIVKRVVATDFKASWIEYGNAHMPEYAPMAKTKAKFRK